MLMSAAFMLSALLQFALSLVVAAILGPGEFGLYALVLSGGVLLQTFAFEWLRLCAARFHHKEAGEALARSLWRKTGYIGFAALATSSLLAAAGIPYGRYYALVPILALIKHRHPHNRTPSPNRAHLCAPLWRDLFQGALYPLFGALSHSNPEADSSGAACALRGPLLTASSRPETPIG